MSTPNKYEPHQSAKEKARRVEQIKKGIISPKQVLEESK